MIRVEEVKTIRDLKRFIKFPYKLYSKNHFWVPSLRKDELDTLNWDKNPAFEYCEAKYWLAIDENEVVGRIAGIINHKHNELCGEKRIRFGWVDFIEDKDVARLLIEAVERWGLEKGLNVVHGPMGFCDMDREGLLVEGFDEMALYVTIYNYPYYSSYLEELGYIKEVDWVEFELQASVQVPDRVNKIADMILSKNNLKVLEAKRAKDVLPYAKGIFKVLNDAYKDLYGVIPLTEKQVDYYVKQNFSFLNPDYLCIMLDKNNEVAAFAIALPSLSLAMKKAKGRLLPFGFIHLLKALYFNKYIDLCLIAVKPELQSKGLNAVLMQKINKAAYKNGILKAYTYPELELNTKVQALWKNYSARQNKRRRCYVKQL